MWNQCIFGEFEVPVSIYFRDWESFPALENYALNLCRGSILDIGAGSGCHSLALFKEGKDVTALDIAPLSVEVMRKRGLPKVIEGDVFEYHAERFDTLLMLMNGIGFVGTLPGLEKFLQHAHNIIKPGGQMIFDSTDLLVENPDAALINAEAQYYGEVEYTMRYKKQTGRAFHWLFVDEKTLRDYCNKTGWYMQKIFEDEDGQYLVKLKPLL